MKRKPICSPASARAGAFTLIELLTVLAVLGVVAGLFLPALQKSKSRVQSISCLNNLKQWGVATHLYLADEEDFLPPEGFPNPGANPTAGWYDALPKQLRIPTYFDATWRTNPAAMLSRSIWICPANPRRSNGRNLFHYCLNEHVDGTGPRNRKVRYSNLNRPSCIVWLFDSKNLPAIGYWSYVHTNLHQEGAQFLFLDGHATRWKRSEYWNDAANKGRTNNPALVWQP